MSKDRYASDHTIEVVGDTQTLTVDGDLDVTGALAVTGNETVGGTLTVTGATTVGTLTITGGDLSLADDLTVTGLSTLGDVTASGTVQRSAAASLNFNLAASAFVPVGNWGAGFTHTVDNDGDGVIVPAGVTLRASHSLAMIPDNCVLDDLVIKFTPGAVSGFTMTVQVFRRSKISGATAQVTNAIVTATSGTSGVFNTDSTVNIAHTIDNDLFTYWCVFTATAPGAATLEFHEVEIDCDVTEYT